MLPALKLFLGLVIAAGTSAAISVPLTLSSNKKVEKGKEDTVETTFAQSGGGASSKPFRVNKCVDNRSSSWTEVNFGNEDAKEVCGTIGEGSEVTQTSQNINEDKYSDLFTNKWSLPTTSGSSFGTDSGNEGRTFCYNGSSYQFGIENSSEQNTNSPQYVGLCIEENSGENQKYVSVQGGNQSNGNLIIKVCSGSGCGQTQGTSSSVRLFPANAQTDKFKIVKFYKKS